MDRFLKITTNDINSKTTGRKRNSLSVSVTHKKKTKPSDLIDCPICSRSFLESVIELHAASCVVSSSQQKKNDIVNDKSDNVKMNHNKMKHRVVAEKGENALNVLMKSANVRPRKEIFNCDKNLKCVWCDENDEEAFEHLKEDTTWSDTMLLHKDILHNGGLFKGSLVEITSAIRSRPTQIPFCKVVASAATLISESFRFDAKRWAKGITSKLSPGVLQSLLQKSIRRNRVGAAVWCACELMLTDDMRFLRRMPIIVFEDSILYPDMSLFVWCMLARLKGFELCKIHVKALLERVASIACCKVKDSIFDVEEIFGKTLYDAKDLNCKFEKTVVFAIECRASFGGMRGDMDMLKAFSKYWIQRFKYGEQNKKSWIMELNSYHENVLRDWTDWKISLPLAGIDFHCCPWIVDQILLEHKSLKAETVKPAIWIFSSSINHREKITTEFNSNVLSPSKEVTSRLIRNTKQKMLLHNRKEELLQTWKAIEKQWESLAKRFLEQKVFQRCDNI